MATGLLATANNIEQRRALRNAGVTGLKIGTGGNVMGGRTPEGGSLVSSAPKGGGFFQAPKPNPDPGFVQRGMEPVKMPVTVNQVGPTATPRLDAGVRTPGLDSNPANPAATRRPMWQQTAPPPKYQAMGDGATAEAPAGSALRRDRQKLFDDMKAAGGTGLNPALQQRAASLGVKDSTFRTVAGKIGKQVSPMVDGRPAAASPSRAMASAPVSKPAAVPAVAASKPASPADQASDIGAKLRGYGRELAGKAMSGGKALLTGLAAPAGRSGGRQAAKPVTAKPNAMVQAWKQSPVAPQGPPSPSLASAAGYGRQAAKPGKLPAHSMVGPADVEKRAKNAADQRFTEGNKRLKAARDAAEAADNVQDWLKGTKVGSLLKTLQKPLI